MWYIVVDLSLLRFIEKPRVQVPPRVLFLSFSLHGRSRHGRDSGTTTADNQLLRDKGAIIGAFFCALIYIYRNIKFHCLAKRGSFLPSDDNPY